MQNHLCQELIRDSCQLEEQENIIRLISDQYTRRLINSIQKESKSAMQISSETGMELNVIYRRLHKLQKHDLLQTTFKITTDEKNHFIIRVR